MDSCHPRVSVQAISEKRQKPTKATATNTHKEAQAIAVDTVLGSPSPQENPILSLKTLQDFSQAQSPQGCGQGFPSHTLPFCLLSNFRPLACSWWREQLHGDLTPYIPSSFLPSAATHLTEQHNMARTLCSTNINHLPMLEHIKDFSIPCFLAVSPEPGLEGNARDHLG